jgi:hypothetical protein
MKLRGLPHIFFKFESENVQNHSHSLKLLCEEILVRISCGHQIQKSIPREKEEEVTHYVPLQSLFGVDANVIYSRSGSSLCDIFRLDERVNRKMLLLNQVKLVFQMSFVKKMDFSRILSLHLLLMY